MTEHKPTLAEWRRLYEAAVQIKKLAPWQEMTEIEVFGVQDPKTDKIGFVSVMGLLGEHFGLAVYLGVEGLYRFWDLEAADPANGAVTLLEIPHLQASFENREVLESKDRQIIKELGLRFRGKGAWLMFRNVCPGCLPWFIEAEEVRYLTHVLEQSTDVLSRYKDNPSLLEPPDGESYLIRVQRRMGDALEWQDRSMRIPLH